MGGKYFKKKKGNHKTLAQKHKHILVPSQKYQDLRHILQNQKVPENVMGFNNHSQRVT